MVKEYIAEAATVDEAIALGAKELGMDRSDINFEILEEGTKKHFGFGTAKPAKVRVYVSEEILQENNEKEEDDSYQRAPLKDASETSVVSEERFNSLDVEDLTDEQVDAIADEAIATVKKLAKYCGAKNIEVEEYEGDEGEVILDIVGDDLAYLIGRHGRTIEALQTVTSAMVTKKMGIRYPITVDVEGYRHRRKQKVIDIAAKAADRAMRSGRPVSLRPMSPQERRIVHIAIREVMGVTSSSEGAGDSRHVVVTPC